MLYNPITKDLFTDDKVFLKKLYCPYDLTWDDNFTSIDGFDGKHCTICNKTVHDTKSLTDKEINDLIKRDSEICVKLELDQNNIRVTLHNNIQEK